MNKVFITILSLFIVTTACKKVPITGRKQVKLLPNSTLNSMSFTEYQKFLSSNPPSSNQQKAQQVQRVGRNIQRAVESYFRQKGQSKYLAGYKWEFNLVDDPAVNAWCMPGGKVVVYSGILPICQNDDGLAVVMGHEIAHAIANHGNERMSQGLVAQGGGVALSVALANKPQQTQQLFMQAYGVGAQVGAILPFSRLHESEADELGLIFMAMAGYNPDEGAPFWGRMAKASGGAAPPEFLSTHPSHSRRVNKLKAAVPKARAYATKYGKAKK